MLVQTILRAVLFAALVLCSSSSFAYDIDASCSMTPQIWSLYPPPTQDNFANSNDLTRIPGRYVRAQGEVIALRGRVLDSNCVPVTDAVVEIWQPNFLGYYQKEVNDFDEYDENFLGNGKIMTDNLGNYNFITIMPGSTKERAPHINIRVRHPDFFVFETQIYFENQFSNMLDSVLLEYTTEDDRHLVIARIDPNSIIDRKFNQGPVYLLDIVLESANKFKKY